MDKRNYSVGGDVIAGSPVRVFSDIADDRITYLVVLFTADGKMHVINTGTVSMNVPGEG